MSKEDDDLREWLDELLQRVISNYFPDETDPILIKLFQSFSEATVNINHIHQVSDLDNPVEFLKSPTRVIKTLNAGAKHVEEFGNKHTELLSSPDFVSKYTRFTLAYLSEWAVSVPENLRGQILTAKKHSLVEQLSIEQDEEIKKYLRQTVDHLAILISKESLQIKSTELNPIWIYQEQELQKLSRLLCQQKFIEDDASFYQVFASNFTKPCRWRKTATSLIYLFHLLFNNETLFPDPSISFISSRFISKKYKPFSNQNLQTQYRQIENIIGQKEQHLTRDYLAIHLTLKEVFTKP